MSKNYNFILLDWDGCMAKTLDVWMDTYMRLYKEAGVTATPEEVIERSWGNTFNGPKAFGIDNPESFWDKIVEEVKKGVKQVELYPNVKETVEKLKKRGKKLAIVTSSEQKLVEPGLKFHGLDSLIDEVVTEDDVQHPKPHPEMLDIALDRLSGNKEEAIIVGDTGKDIIAGKNAGIDSILVLHQTNKQFYDFNQLEELDATYKVEGFEEILETCG